VVQSEVATAQAVSSGDSAVAVSAEAQAITIGLDSRHFWPVDPAWGLLGSNFSEFRATLTGLTYSNAIKNSFTTSDLNGLSALILYQPQDSSGFSVEEITAIQTFVQGGGGLFVIAENFGPKDDLNSILQPYGIQYADGDYFPNGVPNYPFWYHPITKGLQNVGLAYSCGMHINPPAMDMTVLDDNTSEPGRDFLAVWEGDGGAGKVVCTTDSSTFSNGGNGTTIFLGDNRLFLQNVLRFIVGQNPYDCSGPIPATYFRSCFESSEECWEQISGAPAFDAPGFSRAGGGIGLSPNGSRGSFGYWSSPALSVEAGRNYLVSWVVRSTTAAELCPQFRLRINDTLGRDALYRAVESRMAGENSPGTSDRQYWILYNARGALIDEITLSFDLLSFAPDDDLNSTVQLREVRVIPFVYEF